MAKEQPKKQMSEQDKIINQLYDMIHDAIDAYCLEKDVPIWMLVGILESIKLEIYEGHKPKLDDDEDFEE